jgi:hypothetical protein
MDQKIIEAIADDASQLLAELRLRSEFRHTAYQLVTAAMPVIVAFETGRATRGSGELVLASPDEDSGYHRHPVRNTDTPLG